MKVKLNFGLELNVEKPSSGKKGKKESGFFRDWKVLTAAATAMLVFSTAGYAVITHDEQLFDKVLDSLVGMAQGASPKH
ncbi:hypothetical protein [Noviherbaspirillum galbum]|uniref:Uncharacterized protein n=1 Tax=Noviherbaspirillum galbum TaxID=2709383 RepID=A0A6B3SSD6_9BURK|nr:hypothetical protein [Noviherbaspirillum galbum]NEX61736.1 hypothetical protein [Noviherbaspirillum galbum]